MAGHSHWSKVKRAKGASDVKRGALFSKLAKEITVATRLSGGDPNFNPRLRTAITAARAESMPVDNIDRAIKKGTGELEGGGSIEEITYEGYGPGGVALMVETQTDNKNRTAAEIRHLFTKHGGNLGGSNSVAWMFRRRGVFLLENANPDAALEATLEAGADDVRPAGDNSTEVVCPPDRFDAVDKALHQGDLDDVGVISESLGKRHRALEVAELIHEQLRDVRAARRQRDAHTAGRVGARHRQGE